jgi:Tetratricopeptide repeat
VIAMRFPCRPAAAVLIASGMAALLLAGCVTPPPPAPAWVGPPPATLVAEIRAAQAFVGDKANPGELDVQPLRDPMVEDLRVRAAALEGQGDHAGAAKALDEALAISPDDPALLQERAEAAVLLQDLATADRLARRGDEIGAKVGPLCRRHWATVREVQAQIARQREAQAALSTREEDAARFRQERDAASALEAEAAERLKACTMTGPPRY